jgi:lipoprotein signal peptidase
MNTPKRWVTLLGPLLQALIAVNLGMALQRLDDGRASFTVIAISMSVIGLAFLVIAQTRQRLSAAQNDHIGSRP